MSWKAKTGEIYYYLSGILFNVMTQEAGDQYFDDILYNSGNMYRTKQQAEQLRCILLETMKKFQGDCYGT